MNVDIYFDGGSRGNPGPAAAGVVILQSEPRRTLLEGGFYLGRLTNNVAEYRGLLRALELALNLGAQEASIHSDSELLVNQLTGRYRVKSRDLQPLYQRAQSLLLKLERWDIRHLYRHANRRADELVNLALDRQSDLVIYGGGEAAARAYEREAAGAYEREAGGDGAGADAPPSKPPAKSSRRRDQAPPQRAASPAWTVELESPPGEECPAACPPGTAYDFGPATPAGFCVFAAQAVLDELPLKSADAPASESTTECGRCGVAIRIRPREPASER